MFTAVLNRGLFESILSRYGFRFALEFHQACILLGLLLYSFSKNQRTVPSDIHSLWSYAFFSHIIPWDPLDILHFKDILVPFFRVFIKPFLFISLIAS
jgi:hypothetical protein